MSESYHTQNHVFHFIPHSSSGDTFTIMVGSKVNQAYPTLTKNELKELADLIYKIIGEKNE